MLVFEGYRCILYMICAQRPHMWAHPTFIVMFKELVKILPKDGRPAATYGQGHVYFIIKSTLARTYYVSGLKSRVLKLKFLA